MVEEVCIGPIENFPEGSNTILEVGGRSIGVYHSHGELFAVQNLCPHALAPICLESLSGTYLPGEPGEYIYGMDGLVLRCIWHGWEYDVRTGEALFGIDRRRLATFPVMVADGQVFLRLRTRRSPMSVGLKDAGSRVISGDVE